jgi:tRNA G18 (ribose-2'-O)-methylase SpoU
VCNSPIKAENRTITPRQQKIKTDQTLSDLDVVLDNIRSVLNVGSIFRTADAVGVNHLYLCGITPTPDHPKLVKTSLGAEWSIPWKYSPNALNTIYELKRSGKTIYCLEESPTSKSVFELTADISTRSMALVIGNEIIGVDPGIMDACDQVVGIPMLGYKRSLNVAVAFGIAIYQIRYLLFQAKK